MASRRIAWSVESKLWRSLKVRLLSLRKPHHDSHREKNSLFEKNQTIIECPNQQVSPEQPRVGGNCNAWVLELEIDCSNSFNANPQNAVVHE